MHSNNTPENSEPPEKIVRRMQNRGHLGRILSAHKLPSEKPNDKPLSRQARASVKCCNHLLETNPRDNVSFITITTRTWDAKGANSKLSSIIEKIVKPQSTAIVRFFHRTNSGRVHWHLLVAHRCAVFIPGGASKYENMRSYERAGFSPPDYLRVKLQEILTPEAKGLIAQIRRAMQKVKLGYKARIEPVTSEDGAPRYLAHYISGTARYGRYRYDKGIRLWAASRSVKVQNAECQCLSSWSRNQRLKMATYCGNRGWHSMEQARWANPRWHYHARDALNKLKLRSYLFEADFVADWGGAWSPEACGVRILHPGKCPPEQFGPGKPFFYRDRQFPITPEQRAMLAEKLAHSSELPPGIWKGSI